MDDPLTQFSGLYRQYVYRLQLIKNILMVKTKKSYECAIINYTVANMKKFYQCLSSSEKLLKAVRVTMCEMDVLIQNSEVLESNVGVKFVSDKKRLLHCALNMSLCCKW